MELSSIWPPICELFCLVIKGLQTFPNCSWNLAMDRSHLQLNQTPSQSLLGWVRLLRHWRSARLKCTPAWIPMLPIMSGWLSGQFYRLWTSRSTSSIPGSWVSSLVKGESICGQCHLRWGSSHLPCWAAQLHWVVRNASTYSQPQDRCPHNDPSKHGATKDHQWYSLHCNSPSCQCHWGHHLLWTLQRWGHPSTQNPSYSLRLGAANPVSPPPISLQAMLLHLYK